ncbi:hypothetical protein B0J18DRAFT_441264 [Chaetomium sp. MPI-SDFR-AT-0129]|nr:hypothetical protein B0J18DRAFT_441264 [Chaetomium sp. MPI-SDFR-AT-0129]
MGLLAVLMCLVLILAVKWISRSRTEQGQPRQHQIPNESPVSNNTHPRELGSDTLHSSADADPQSPTQSNAEPHHDTRRSQVGGAERTVRFYICADGHLWRADPSESGRFVLIQRSNSARSSPRSVGLSRRPPLGPPFSIFNPPAPPSTQQLISAPLQPISPGLPIHPTETGRQTGTSSPEASEQTSQPNVNGGRRYHPYRPTRPSPPRHRVSPRPSRISPTRRSPPRHHRHRYSPPRSRASPPSRRRRRLTPPPTLTRSVARTTSLTPRAHTTQTVHALTTLATRPHRHTYPRNIRAGAKNSHTSLRAAAAVAVHSVGRYLRASLVAGLVRVSEAMERRARERAERP